MPKPKPTPGSRGHVCGQSGNDNGGPCDTLSFLLLCSEKLLGFFADGLGFTVLGRESENALWLKP